MPKSLAFQRYSVQHGRRADLMLSLMLISLIVITLSSIVPRLVNFIFVASNRLLSLSATPTPPFGLESIDRLTWVTMLTLTALLCILAISGRMRLCLAFFPNHTWKVLTYLILTGISIAWVEPIDYKGLWNGFGMSILIATAILVPIFLALITVTSSQIFRLLGISAVALFVIAYLPSLIQPSWGIQEPTHTAYVFNEVLAPFAGVFPLSESVTQYTSVMGLPILPALNLFSSLVGPASILPVVSAYMSALSVVVIVGLVATTYFILPPRIRLLAPLMVIPMVLLKAAPGDERLGSITALFSALPVRTLGPVLIAVLIALPSSWIRLTYTRILIIGIIAGANALNNFEFGIPVFLATAAVMVLRQRDFGSRRRAFGLFLVGAVIPTIAYAAFLYSRGLHLDLSLGVKFILGFSSGFGNYPMPAVGTFIFLASVLIATTVLSFGFLASRFSRNVSEVNAHGSSMNDLWIRAASVGVLFGASGLGSWAYYSGRSVTSGQLQIFLIYVAPCIAVCLSLTWISVSSSRRIRKRPARSVLLVIGPALCLACVLLAPDPHSEWDRISFAKIQFLPNQDVSKFEFSTYLDDVKINAQRASDALRGGNFVAAADFGNLVTSVVGIRNFSAVDVINDVAVVEPLKEPYCSLLRKSKLPILAKDFFQNQSQLCPGFTRITWLDADGAWSLIQNDLYPVARANS